MIGYKIHDGLVNHGRRKRYREQHSENEFADGHDHISGIGNFWGLRKVCLAKFKGVHKHTFVLHIKECEYRYNLTILECYHFGSFRNFKHYCLFCIRGILNPASPMPSHTTSPPELVPRVSFHMMLSATIPGGVLTRCPKTSRLTAWTRKDGITVSSSTCRDDRGEVMTFCLARSDVDIRDARVWNVSVKELHSKIFADRGHIRQELFKKLSDYGIHVHGLKADTGNRIMSTWIRQCYARDTSSNASTNS